MLTIAGATGGAPLLEIIGTGAIEILPELVQVLTESGPYFYNIWRMPPEGACDRVARGKLTVGPSIPPSGVDFSTTFLAGFGTTAGITRLVALTRADYEALTAPEATTLYIVR